MGTLKVAKVWSALTFCVFGITFPMQSARAQQMSVDWNNPPTLEKQFQIHGNTHYPYKQNDLLNLRQQTNQTIPFGDLKNKILNSSTGVRTGSGGGGAIVCFPDWDTADRAVDISNLRMIPGQEHLITNLIIFDSFNTDLLESGFIPAHANESGWSYLQRILRERIMPANPKRGAELAEALEAVRPDRWIPRTSLPYYDDTGEALHPLSPIASIPQCPVSRYVQLVIRYEHPTTKQVMLDADYGLLARIFTLNTNALYKTYSEALIIQHEALYFIASKKGVRNSRMTRNMNGSLLSNRFYQNPGKTGAMIEEKFRYISP